ncbi:hypothetical protein Tsubulata_047428, partial [Turnera subulata]
VELEPRSHPSCVNSCAFDTEVTVHYNYACIGRPLYRDVPRHGRYHYNITSLCTGKTKLEKKLCRN